jgi:hypothetical protein
MELAQVPTRTMSIVISKTRMSLQIVRPFEFLPSLLSSNHSYYCCKIWYTSLDYMRQNPPPHMMGWTLTLQDQKNSIVNLVHLVDDEIRVPIPINISAGEKRIRSNFIPERVTHTQTSVAVQRWAWGFYAHWCKFFEADGTLSNYLYVCEKWGWISFCSHLDSVSEESQLTHMYG